MLGRAVLVDSSGAPWVVGHPLVATLFKLAIKCLAELIEAQSGSLIDGQGDLPFGDRDTLHRAELAQPDGEARSSARTPTPLRSRGWAW